MPLSAGDVMEVLQWVRFFKGRTSSAYSSVLFALLGDESDAEWSMSLMLSWPRGLLRGPRVRLVASRFRLFGALLRLSREKEGEECGLAG